MSRLRPRRRCTFWLPCSVLLLLASPAPAESELEQKLQPRLTGLPLLQALEKGGYVILFRHGATEPGSVDSEAVDLDDCASQRNLSELGRQQSRWIGEAIRKLGIPVGQVLSSPYCRCLQTAELAFGKATTSEILSSGDDLPGSQRGAEVRKLLDTPPEAGTNTVLVSHTAALLYSFGLSQRPEGIAHVFEPQEYGAAAYVGQVVPEEWPRLAGLDPDAPADPAPAVPSSP